MPAKCRECGRNTNEKLATCTWCGALLTPPVECPGCKRKIAAHLKLCQYCGTNVTPPTPAGAPPPPAEVIACRKCGKNVAVHNEKCHFCGTLVSQPDAAAIHALTSLVNKPVSSGASKEAMMWAGKGNGLAVSGQFVQALECYEKALLIDQRCAWAHASKGLAFVQLGLFKDGLAFMDMALSIDPSIPNLARARLGLAALKQEALNRVRGIAPAAPAVPAPPPAQPAPSIPQAATPAMQPGAEVRVAQAWAKRACVFNNAMQYEQALAHVDRALQIDPHSSVAFTTKITVLGNMGRAEEALGQVLRVLERYPGNAELLRMKQQLEMQKQAAASGKGIPRAGMDVIIDCNAQADDLRAKASALDDQNRLPEALASYDAAVQLDPMFANAWCDRGVTLKKMGRFDDAIASYDKALALDPFSAFAWNNRANCLLALNRPQEAVACYDKALELDPANANIQATRELCLNKIKGIAGPVAEQIAQLGVQAANFKQAGRIEESLACLDKALALDPRAADLWYNKGNTFYGINRFEEAVACYNKAVEFDSRQKKACLNRGVALEALNRPQEALKSYEQALAIDPTYANANARLTDLMNRIPQAAVGGQAAPPPVAPEAAAQAEAQFKQGVSLFNTQKFADALPFFQRAAQLNPGHSNAWNYQSASLGELKRLDEAFACSDKALQADPKNIFAWNNRGNLFQKQNKHLESADCFTRALEVAPNNALLWSNKGTSLLEAGRPADALPAFDRALQIDPKDAFAWSNKCSSLMKLKRYDEALACSYKVLELRPLDGTSFYNHGCVLGKLARYTEALAAYDQSLAFKPDARACLNNKAETLNKLKRHPEALAAADKALALAPKFCFAMNNKAEALIQLGRAVEALPLLKTSQELDAKNPETWYHLGQCHQALGSPWLATDMFTKFLGMNPEDHEELVADAKAQLTKLGAAPPTAGAPQKERSAEEIMFGGGPKSAEEFLKLVAAKQGNAPAQPAAAAPPPPPPIAPAPAAAPAPAGFRGVALLAPNADEQRKPTGPLIMAALNAMSGGTLEKSLPLFDSAVRLDPKSVIAWNGKGVALFLLNRFQEAIACIDKALNCDGRVPGLWVNKAVCLLALKRHEEALSAYDQALSLDDKQQLAWAGKAATLTAMGKHQEATWCNEEALEIAKQSGMAIYGRAVAFDSKGQLNEAKAEYQRFLALNLGAAMAQQTQHATARLAAMGVRVPTAGAPSAPAAASGGAASTPGKNPQVEALMQQAMSFFETDQQKAVNIFEQIVKLDPKEARAWAGLAILMQGAQVYDQALVAHQMVTSLRPNHAESWLKHADCLECMNRLDESLAHYDKALAIDPNYTAALNDKGHVLNRLGRREEAIACYEKSLALNPRYHLSWFNKAGQEMLLGRLEAAANSLKQFLECVPPGNDQLVAKAKQMLQQAQSMPAKAQVGAGGGIARASHLAPEHQLRIKPLYEQMQKAQQAGNFADALKSAEEMLKVEPRFVPAWVNKGEFLLALKKNAEAMAAFDQALQLQPDDADALNGKACVMKDSGQAEASLPVFDRAQALAPTSPGIVYNKGNALRMLGRLPEASQAYLQAWQIDKNHSGALNNYVTSLFHMGQHDKVLEFAPEALRLQPRSPHILALQGSSMMKLNRLQDALPVLAKAVELDPMHTQDAAVDLGVCLQKLGRQAEADAAFDKAALVTPFSGRAYLYKALAEERRGKLDEAREFLYRATECFKMQYKRGAPPPDAAVEIELANRRQQELGLPDKRQQ